MKRNVFFQVYVDSQGNPVAKDMQGRARVSKITVNDKNTILFALRFWNVDLDTGLYQQFDLGAPQAMRLIVRESRDPDATELTHMYDYNQGELASFESLSDGQVTWLTVFNSTAIDSFINGYENGREAWLEISMVNADGERNTLCQVNVLILPSMDDGSNGDDPTPAEDYLTTDEIAAAYVPKSELAFRAVVSRTTDPLPSASGTKNSYLVPAGATGSGAGHDGEIAYDYAGSWIFYPPSAGWTLTVNDESGQLVRYDGAAWQNTTVSSATQLDDGANTVTAAQARTHIDDASIHFEQVTGVAVWNSGLTYAVDEFCNYGGLIYKSLLPANTNKEPGVEVTYWEEYSPGGTGTDEKVKFDASDPTAGYLVDKFDTDEFQERDSDNVVEIKALAQSKVTGLVTALAGKADVGDYVPQDLSGETQNTGTPEATERIFTDKNGTPGYRPATDFATAAELAALEAEIGMLSDENVSAYSDDDNGKHYVFEWDPTTPAKDDSIILLLHMPGVEGTTTFLDYSDQGHTVARQGAAIVSSTIRTKYGHVLLCDGSTGLDINVSQYNPGSGNWFHYLHAKVESGQEAQNRVLMHCGTGSDTTKVFELRYNNGGLEVRIGEDGVSGWDSVLTYTAEQTGWLDDDWNHIIVCRIGDYVYIGLNGTLIEKAGYSFAGKTLPTPDVASRFRIGYGLDSGSNPAEFFRGEIDEVIVAVGEGSNLLDVDPTAGTWTDFTDEYAVDKAKILDNVSDQGFVEGTFDSGDVDTDGAKTWIDIAHNLNAMPVDVLLVEPDGADYFHVEPYSKKYIGGSASSVRVFLTNLTITGTWKYKVMSGRAGTASGGGGSATTIDDLIGDIYSLNA